MRRPDWRTGSPEAAQSWLMYMKVSAALLQIFTPEVKVVHLILRLYLARREAPRSQACISLVQRGPWPRHAGAALK